MEPRLRLKRFSPTAGLEPGLNLLSLLASAYLMIMCPQNKDKFHKLY